MRRTPARACLALVVSGVLGLTALTGANPASAAGGTTASFTTSSDWGDGHQVNVTVTNTGSAPLSTWALKFELPTDTSITSSWDADVVRTGDAYTATPTSWSGSLAPGASTNFGYLGTGGARNPVSCSIGGGSCTDGGGPAPTTPPTTAPPTDAPPTTKPPVTQPPVTQPPTTGAAGSRVVGYFTEWGTYDRNYQVKNIETSGSAEKLDTIVYAFGNTSGGKCTMGDSYAATDKAFTAAESVDGVADTWDQELRGNFNQLRKLKKMNPGLKVVWSFGGWTWSGGFTQAAANPAAFADSCRALVEDPRWADVFDGIDVDWEYPNACGLSCDTSGPDAYNKVISALRERFGTDLVTSAITADGSDGGKIDATDYATATKKLDWLMVMTYDYFGAFNAQGPTAPHSPLNAYPGIPQEGFNSEAAIDKLLDQGVAAEKMLLGVGFYGRGWTGVTEAEPGGTATGGAPGRYETGIEDYKVLKEKCPVTGQVAGTNYAKCGNEWWSYDDPASMKTKMDYVNSKGLGGSFFWELSGDTPDGELISAISGGLG